MREPQLAAQVMQQLRSIGVRFAIARAFVMNLDRSASNNMIVRTTIDLGHATTAGMRFGAGLFY